jgi:hypothetical protein
MGLGAVLIPFWLLASIVFLVERLEGLVRETTSHQVALVHAANAIELHLVMGGFVGMAMALVACAVVIKSREST